jgi:hypothetical protein
MVTAVDGKHWFCFDNNFSTVTTKKVHFEIIADHQQNQHMDRDESSLAQQGTMNGSG